MLAAIMSFRVGHYYREISRELLFCYLHNGLFLIHVKSDFIQTSRTKHLLNEKSMAQGCLLKTRASLSSTMRESEKWFQYLYLKAILTYYIF